MVLVILLASVLACGRDGAPGADNSTAAVGAATIAVIVTFDGPAPPATMIRIDGDPKCAAENGGPERPAESIVLGPDRGPERGSRAGVENRGLANVFVYVRSGLERMSFPVPADPVVLDQQKCRFVPRVFGIRAGQPLEIRNADALLHNVRTLGRINEPFTTSQPVQGVKTTRVFTTSEVMVPVRCDVHGWMQAWAGVLPHPFFGVTGATGRVALAGLPAGTYTVEAWHEELGTKSEHVTIGAKDTRDVTFTFAR